VRIQPEKNSDLNGIHNCLSCVYNCDDQSCLNIFFRSSNIWYFVYSLAWCQKCFVLLLLITDKNIWLFFPQHLQSNTVPFWQRIAFPGQYQYLTVQIRPTRALPFKLYYIWCTSLSRLREEWDFTVYHAYIQFSANTMYIFWIARRFLCWQINTTN